MITYTYIVKCPECEDEFFDFFDEAKEFALSCLTKKPIITQTEVNRNDFGECTDHCDLGTVWSWEDMMGKETDAEPTTSIFTKDDFAGFEDDYNPENDPEFYDIDNSVAFEPETSEATNIDEVPDNFRKPVPDNMTIEELVETMEENEDTVECTKCGNLVEKASCTHNKEGFGWCCTECEPADTLTEESAESKLFDPNEEIEFEYRNLSTTVMSSDWDEATYTKDYTFTVTAEDVATTIWEVFLTHEDVADVPGGFDTLEDDTAWKEFLDTHFEALLEKYGDQLGDYYKEFAQEEFDNTASWEDYNNDAAADYWDNHDGR